jgi:outer membrane receptor protein involved in Fe transport
VALIGGLGVVARPARAAENQPNAGALETITVTARKREEKLINVPVAATVLTGAAINAYAITDLTQINTIAPGLDITREPGGFPGASVSIRGIENFGTGDAGAEQPVSIVVDGIPISRGYIVDAGFFDQASIQVLKGPQALFFGKNSPAGVVDISSVSPRPGRPMQGYVKASYGFSEQDPVLEGAVSLPVTDTLAIRLAARGEDMQGGYVRNGAVPVAANPSGYPVTGPNFKTYPATKELIGRFTAVWMPTNNFDLNFKYLASYYHDNSANGSTVLIHCDNGVHPYYHNLLTGAFIEDTAETCGNSRTTYDGTLPAAVLAGFPGAPKDGKYYTLVRQSVASLVMNYHLPHVTITSNTGFYKLHAGEFDDFDMDTFAETPVLQVEDTTLWTQELRAVTKFDWPINFTVGAFWEHEHRQYDQQARIFTLGGYPVPGPFFGVTADYINNDRNIAEDYSFFGEANWKILDNLELAAGGRWTSAHKSSDIGQPFQYADLFYAGLPGGAAVNDPSFTPTGNVYHLRPHYTNFSPEATLTWRPTSHLMLYIAYKTGFLAGGVENSGVVPNYTQMSQAEIASNLTYAPETVKGEEIGAKGSFLGGRLSADAALYRYEYDGLQIATYHVATTSFTVGNAASSLNEGIDFNLAYRVNERLSLHGSVNYVLNQFIKYENAPCYAGEVCPSGTQDLSGKRFSGPPLEIHLGASYEQPVSDNYRFGVMGELATYSRTPEIDLQPDTATSAYTLVNATLRLFKADGSWEASLIGTNLTNAFYASNIFGKPLGKNQDIIGVANPGREIRLQFVYRFGGGRD